MSITVANLSFALAYRHSNGYCDKIEIVRFLHNIILKNYFARCLWIINNKKVVCLNWLRAVSSLVQEVLNIQYVALKISKIVESDKFEWIKFYGVKILCTMELQFNKMPRDRGNWFVILRVCYDIANSQYKEFAEKQPNCLSYWGLVNSYFLFLCVVRCHAAQHFEIVFVIMRFFLIHLTVILARLKSIFH